MEWRNALAGLAPHIAPLLGRLLGALLVGLLASLGLEHLAPDLLEGLCRSNSSLSSAPPLTSLAFLALTGSR